MSEQQENAPTKNPVLGLHTRIHFGQYEGSSITKLLKTDPFYLAWMCDEVDWLKLSDDAERELQKPIELNRFFTLPFGNYTGRKLFWVLNNDMSYFIWLVDDLLTAYPNISFDDSIMEMYDEALTNAKEGEGLQKSYSYDTSMNF